MQKFASSFAVAALLVGGFASTSQAHAGVALGLLTCRSTDSAGYLVTSTRKFDCTFVPSVSGETQYYKAIVRRYGAQIGYSGNTTMTWAVLAKTSRVGPAALPGEYGGVSVGGAMGVGASANGLVGGLDNAISLQPVSVEGQTGLNVVATVTALELDSVLPLRHRRYHRHHRHA